MKTDTNLSRRRLLASMPAAAAAMAPAAASALTGLPTGVVIPAHLDARQFERHLDLLAMLDRLPNDEANKVLTAITEVIDCSMRTHAHDAELMALKPQFDAVFDEWWQRIEAQRRHLGEFNAELERRTGLTRAQGDQLERGSPEFEAYRVASIALSDESPSSRSDEEVDQEADEMFALIDKILTFSPLTRDGLRLQCRALIMDNYDDWNENVAKFVGSVVLFFNIELPGRLAAKLMAVGWSEGDEGEEDEDSEA